VSGLIHVGALAGRKRKQSDRLPGRIRPLHPKFKELPFNMFKRIEKRRHKKAEEEELGLDEDLKEVLVMHYTDSDESDTDSESSNEDNGAREDQGLDRGSDGNPSGANDIDEQGGEDSTDAEEEGKPPISIREALRDPLYIIGLDPGLRACVVCPGKLLKNSKMVEIHRIAKACIPIVFVERYLCMSSATRHIADGSKLSQKLRRIRNRIKSSGTY
jgi:hypothetical protein